MHTHYIKPPTVLELMEEFPLGSRVKVKGEKECMVGVGTVSHALNAAGSDQNGVVVQLDGSRTVFAWPWQLMPVSESTETIYAKLDRLLSHCMTYVDTKRGSYIDLNGNSMELGPVFRGPAPNDYHCQNEWGMIGQLVTALSHCGIQVEFSPKYRVSLSDDTRGPVNVGRLSFFDSLILAIEYWPGTF